MEVFKRCLAVLEIIWCISQVYSFSLKGKQLVGTIEFQDASDAPEKLEDGSCLNLALQDATDFTTAAKELARTTDKEIKEPFDKDKTLKYRINMPELDLNEKKKYSIFAVLNNGWCKKEENEIDSGEWIKDGDFLTDTKFVVDDFEKCKKESSEECHGPKISLVQSKNEDEGKKHESKDNEKEDKDDKDNRDDR